MDGNIYHGEFFEDEVHGRGRLTICPGSILEEVYDGEFVRGVKHGRGIYVYRKGDGMVGEISLPPCFASAVFLCYVGRCLIFVDGKSLLAPAEAHFAA